MNWRKYLRFVPIASLLLYYSFGFTSLSRGPFGNLPFVLIVIVASLIIHFVTPGFSSGYRKTFTAYLTAQNYKLLPDPEPRDVLPPHMMQLGDLFGTTFEIQAAGENIVDGEALTLIYCDAVYHGKNSTTRIPFVALVMKLPSAMNGWAHLRPANSYFAGFTSDIQMESVEFNKEVDVRASSKELAFQVFSPDFMNWYLALAHRPWIHVEGNTCVVVFEGMPKPEHIDALMVSLQQAAHFVAASGVLAAPPTMH